MVSSLIFVFPVFFLLYICHETPLFLLASGREMEASIVARKCAMIPHVSYPYLETFTYQLVSINPYLATLT